MKKHKHWTPAEDKKLRDGVAGGLSIEQIAEQVGRTYGGTKWRLAHLGIHSNRLDPRAWSAEQEATLREQYGKPGVCTRKLARKIGKTLSAVKNRALQLGLKHYKFWSAEELQALRDRYATDDPKTIAKDLGRHVGVVYQQARKLGLIAKKYVPPHTPEQYEAVRRLHGEGRTDLEISAATGIDRRSINAMRHKLGLDVILDPTAKKRGVANQLKTLGLTSPTQLRTRAFALFAIENGWPEDLRPREVQILNALVAADRPLTKMEIAAAIGMRTDGKNSKHGGPKSLVGNGPGGTYTATLARRGLIHRIRHYKGGRGTLQQSTSTYMLTPLAIAIRVEWQSQQIQKEQSNGTTRTQPQRSEATNASTSAGRLDLVPA